MGTRALEGRRTEALVCRPSRAGRVLAPIFRWFLHRLISKAPPARKNIFLNAIGSSPTQSTPVRTLTEPYPGAHGTGSGSDRAPLTRSLPLPVPYQRPVPMSRASIALFQEKFYEIFTSEES